MRSLPQAIRLLLADLAASLFFLVLYATTHNAVLSACLGVLLGLLQLAVHFARRKPVDMMEWLSLFLVIAAGAATILTGDARFVLFKPSAIYAIVGIAMLRPGWMNRYLPEIARTVAPDIATYVGFAWAFLMFVSATLNAYLALRMDLASWALAMASFAIASKVIVFIGGFAAIRLIVRRRMRAMPTDQRQSLLIATGWHASASPPVKTASAPRS